ncbi:hypothetical protein ACE6H2_004741 [Prunus campanulata]
MMQEIVCPKCSLPDSGEFFSEEVSTTILDSVENPIHLKNLSLKLLTTDRSVQELKQLSDEIRSELSSIMSKTRKSFKASLGVVELTVAMHHVFHAPVDKILWDVVEQTYTHKILTGRRDLIHTVQRNNGLSGSTSQSESEYDPFGAGHGCSSVSAGLGMAIARDIKGKRERVVTVISNGSTVAGQVYEAMGNAGYLDSNMIVILNDSRHSLHPMIEEGPKTAINALSSTLSKLQSSKSFRKFREVAKSVTKRIGGGLSNSDDLPSKVRPRTYSDCFMEALVMEAEKDKYIVVHDVDRQRIPVRFVITSAGLVGSDGPLQCGAFDITFMSCLPNMIVMAPSNEVELANMVATAAYIDDRPVCFRYPRGALVGMEHSICSGNPIEIGKGKILTEGNDVALLGYGSMVQNCLKARSLLSKLGIEVTVADARFCKPLDINLLRQLCRNHSFLITVEEGSIGGFGSHVAQFFALDGQLDGSIKWRPIVLPDNYIEHASPNEQLAIAGLTGHHIAATALSLLGRNREALHLMC